MIFNDEPDKYFTGTVTGFDKPEPGRNAITGSITFECLDPFKYSVKEYTAELNSGQTLEINYGGTDPAYPVISFAMTSRAGAESVTINEGNLKFGIDEPPQGTKVNGKRTDGPWNTSSVSELTAAGFVYDYTNPRPGHGGLIPYFANIAEDMTYDLMKTSGTCIEAYTNRELHGFRLDASSLTLPSPPSGNFLNYVCWGGWIAHKTVNPSEADEDWAFEIDRLYLRNANNREVGYQSITIYDTDNGNNSPVPTVCIQINKKDQTLSLTTVNILIRDGATMKVIDSWQFNYSDWSQSFNRDMIIKKGTSLTIKAGAFSKTYKLPSSTDFKCQTVVLGCLGRSDFMDLAPYPTMAFGRPNYISYSDASNREYEFAFIDTDVLEVDSGSGAVMLNGATAYDLGNAENNWEASALRTGKNTITATQSAWASSAAAVTLKYREVYR
jgi:phage-related protein